MSSISNERTSSEILATFHKALNVFEASSQMILKDLGLLQLSCPRFNPAPYKALISAGRLNASDVGRSFRERATRKLSRKIQNFAFYMQKDGGYDDADFFALAVVEEIFIAEVEIYSAIIQMEYFGNSGEFADGTVDEAAFRDAASRGIMARKFVKRLKTVSSGEEVVTRLKKQVQTRLKMATDQALTSCPDSRLSQSVGLLQNIRMCMQDVASNDLAALGQSARSFYGLMRDRKTRFLFI